MKNYIFKFFIFLFCALTISVVYAKPGTFNVGFDKKLIFTYPNDLLEGRSSMPPINFIFPEVFLSSNSAVRFAYTSNEMGGQSKLLTQMKLPFVASTSGRPKKFLDGTYYGSMPVEVTIFIRNASHLPTEGGPVDTSTANGWVKVWDDFFYYQANNFEEIDLKNHSEVDLKGYSINTLVLDFNEPFLYEGKVLEIVLVQKNTDIQAMHFGHDAYLYGGGWPNSYPFLVFVSNDASFSSTNYPGPAWAGEGIVWNLCDYIGCDGHPSPTRGIITLKQNEYSYSLTSDYYRPIVQFTYQNDMQIKAIKSELPEIVRVDESNYNLMELTINTEDIKNPIEIKNMEFQIYSDLGLTNISFAKNISKAKLYYTNKFKSFDISELIGEYEFKGSINKDDIFVINFSNPLVLQEGNNYFWLVYEVPTTNNNNEYLSVQLNLIKTNNKDTKFKSLEHSYYTKIQYD